MFLIMTHMVVEVTVPNTICVTQRPLQKLVVDVVRISGSRNWVGGVGGFGTKNIETNSLTLETSAFFKYGVGFSSMNEITVSPRIRNNPSWSTRFFRLFSGLGFA